MNVQALIAALTVLSAGQLRAQAARPIPDAVVSGGTLSFDGRATTGAFTGTTNSVRGEMSGGNNLSEIRGWVDAPVSSLVTGNGHRDRDLNRSLESDRYPTMRFDLTGVATKAGQGDSMEVILQGRFTIHGVAQEASVPATVITGPDAIRVRGKTPLDLKDYRIGGLSKLMGVFRMDHKILVRIDLTLTPGTTIVAPSLREVVPQPPPPGLQPVEIALARASLRG